MHWWLEVVTGWQFYVAAAHIYREDPPRVTTYCNQVDLSIKHVLDMDS
jgi:hypothetical protein